jgi:hypothetical protein
MVSLQELRQISSFSTYYSNCKTFKTFNEGGQYDKKSINIAYDYNIAYD